MNWIVLLAAIAAVESGGDPRAHNESEDARGVYQIRACVIADVNRHYCTRYTHADAWCPQKSKTIAKRYLLMWDADETYERAARTWNGGPRGHRKRATLGYWRRVRAVLDAGKGTL